MLSHIQYMRLILWSFILLSTVLLLKRLFKFYICAILLQHNTSFLMLKESCMSNCIRCNFIDLISWPPNSLLIGWIEVTWLNTELSLVETRSCELSAGPFLGLWVEHLDENFTLWQGSILFHKHSMNQELFSCTFYKRKLTVIFIDNETR